MRADLGVAFVFLAVVGTGTARSQTRIQRVIALRSFHAVRPCWSFGRFEALDASARRRSNLFGGCEWAVSVIGTIFGASTPTRRPADGCDAIFRSALVHVCARSWFASTALLIANVQRCRLLSIVAKIGLFIGQLIDNIIFANVMRSAQSTHDAQRAQTTALAQTLIFHCLKFGAGHGAFLR